MQNKDPRCAVANNYEVVSVFSKVGYMDGAVGINALVSKTFANLDKLRHKMVTGDSKMPYVKAKVVPGQLGELLEIVSTDGDGKCKWSGMPRIGGTVCPAYGYDYSKDFTAVVYR